MEVSEKVKNAYMGTGKTKYITLEFPELNKSIGLDDIHSNTFFLSEKLVNSSSIEFVGCISSMLKIHVNNVKEDIKGKKIVAKVYTDGTEDEPIPLFKGIVDSALNKSNSRVKEIVAYDEIYLKGSKDIADWYKSLAFPITLKQLRYSLFERIGIAQVEINLPNDNIEIKKQYSPSSLQALSVMKAICQINGVFGIINRNGFFEYRTLRNIEENDGLYPPFYPGSDVFPGISLSALNLDSIQATDFPFYKDVNYEKYIVKPVDKITIRQSESDEGVTYGSGTNNYIIQGNMFTYGLSKDVLLQIASNIYPNVQGFSYHPFVSQNNGLPYLECGLDAVSYMMIDWEKTQDSGDIVYEKKSFYILNREMSGIPGLKDSYSAQGEEYQTEFITDLQVQIDTIKKNIKQEVQDTVGDYTYTKEEVDNKIALIGGWDVKSVPVLPVTVAANTIYLIQGEVVVE